MSARRPHLPVESRIVGDALHWLKQQISETADLHTDSRAVQPGDGFLAYAVEGADNRPHIADAIARGAKAVLLQPFASADASASSASSVAVPLLEVVGLDVLAGKISSEWYGAPSAAMKVIGVTGTNGKTSVTQWLAAALTSMGTPTALIGTLGVGMPERLVPTGFTTPNAAQLQRSLADLKQEGAAAVAMEVSSHALHQGRVNGTAFDVAVFTNLTQDHLDYHHTFEAYEAAKARLFDWPGLSYVVVNQDDAAGRRLLAHVHTLHLQHAKAPFDTAPPIAIAYGLVNSNAAADADTIANAPASYRLQASEVRSTAAGGTAMTVHLSSSDNGLPARSAAIETAVIGEFNMSNLLGVLGALLAVSQLAQGAPSDLGARFASAAEALSRLQAVTGRMQRLGGRSNNDEPLVVIDYAHTPDALEKTLLALRPVAAARGGELVVVFGCGGDRDQAKRPLMGAIAARIANAVVLTSDNPRSETPASIIDQIAAGIEGSSEASSNASSNASSTTTSTHALRRIEDRASAILQAVRTAHRTDVILLAGKGHEATQEIMGKKRPFSDQDHTQLALASRATHLRGETE